MKSIDPQINDVASWPGVYSFELKLKEDDEVHQITSSLNRYGEVIVSADNREILNGLMADYEQHFNDLIKIG